MRPFDVAWNLLKALPGQREMADSGRTMSMREMGYGSDDDVDMGTIHPGALSAMRRLQGEGPLDTRSYREASEPGKLVGTEAERSTIRSGANPIYTGKFYNPDTGQLEDFSEAGRYDPVTYLKSRTIRNYPFNDDPDYEAGRAGNQTQFSPIVTGNTIPIVGGGVDRTQTDDSRHGGRAISSSERRAREKVNVQQMMRNTPTSKQTAAGDMPQEEPDDEWAAFEHQRQRVLE